ncbi:MAG: hypothetical protein KH284_05495 [Clostridiales bacterium]|nr:hypothetical protein [Clostridiales bacterium]
MRFVRLVPICFQQFACSWDVISVDPFVKNEGKPVYKNNNAALRQEAFRADGHFSKASNGTFEAIHTRKTALHKNGVAALRQEAFRADRHFFNASNDLFDAIIS